MPPWRATATAIFIQHTRKGVYPSGRGRRDAASRFVVRRGPRAGQKLVNGGGRVILHAREDVGEVVEGIDRARLAGGNERVKPREACARVAVVNEEIVLPAERDASQRAL